MKIGMCLFRVDKFRARSALLMSRTMEPFADFTKIIAANGFKIKIDLILSRRYIRSPFKMSIHKFLKIHNTIQAIV